MTTKTFNMFIKGYRYDGFDSMPVSSSINDQKIYKEYKRFMEDYFLSRIDFPQDKSNDDYLNKIKKNSLSKNSSNSLSNTGSTNY